MKESTIELLLEDVKKELDAVKDNLKECLDLLKLLYDEVSL